MLDLLRAYTGCPSTGLQHLILPQETLVLYPSFDSIIILNARDLAFIRVLAFWEAFPGALHDNEAIKCLSIDPAMKLIVASMGPRVATWSLSGVQAGTWRVHSSLLLPEDRHVTTLDCKSGLLAVGTSSSLSVYTLILENDLPTWSLKWTLPIARLSRVRFSPSLMYMASTSTDEHTVRVYLTTSGKQTQRIRHPRPVIDMNWRHLQASSRDDIVLYTITSDATVRVFLPVLDSTQQLQLHISLDIFSALPFSIASHHTDSSVFWLDRGYVSRVMAQVLKSLGPNTEDGKGKRIKDIKEEDWDLFLRVLSDGTLIVQAVANIDHRPPTFLKQLVILHTPPGALPVPPSHLYVLPCPPATPSINKDTLTLVTSPPLRAYTLELLSFFDSDATGLRFIAEGEPLPPAEVPTESESWSIKVTHGHSERGIVKFVRTPDGEGLGALRADGGLEVWTWGEHGETPFRRAEVKPGDIGIIEQVVVLESGKIFATYSKADASISLHFPDTDMEPPITLTVPSIKSLFSLPANSENKKSPLSIVAITEDQSILLLHLTLPSSSSMLSSSNPPVLTLHPPSKLPLLEPPDMIISVDPMAWSGRFSTNRLSDTHDVLLSMSRSGELAFWIPEQNHGTGAREVSWKCTGKVRTGRKGINMAACSSAKKSVLVTPCEEGQEITIWDSTESEFASGLEYRQILSSSDPVMDLDWTATPDNQSILAVGFAHRVELLCQQRMTYFDETPGWELCWKIDLTNKIPHEINDSIWLKGGSLLVGAAHILTLYGQPVPSHEVKGEEQPQSLFEFVARRNGPLDDYHPQMILQCLLWEKVELVKNIVINLHKNLQKTRNTREWIRIPAEEFLKKDEVARAIQLPYRIQHKFAFSVPETIEEPDEEEFSREMILNISDHLRQQPLPHLTPNEQESLLVLIQATLEIEEQRRALDSNGLRYLISMRVFYLYNTRPSSPASNGAIVVQPRKRERLRYRDMIWAFHSESQEILLSTSTAACENGKMGWADARALGVFVWLRSVETMKSQMETVARNQYMSGDNRDPTACSLLYFALGKVKLVHGLWRQAAWHKEQSVMLKFLNNDFSQPRWRTSALKNAFALLSKRRFEYAAAFFLLGGSLKDAVNVCIKNLKDFQLAVALARVGEQGDDGPILREILTNTVIPIAFREGNRWLASWAFWLLRRRDLAVRILVTPLQDIAHAWDTSITDIGDQHYDDPSLALLFSQLKLKTLQTAKGTSEISGQTEFKFVLQTARIFCRMGCHALALDLVKSWSFQRPSTAASSSPVMARPPSPVATRFALEPAMRRQSSIMIDMAIDTEPPTRLASPAGGHLGVQPVQPTPVEELKQESDLFARKAGMGNLIKSAKQTAQVPEFDMNAFF